MAPSVMTLWRRKNRERARATARAYEKKNATILNLKRRVKRSLLTPVQRSAVGLRSRFVLSKERALYFAERARGPCDVCHRLPTGRAHHVDHDHHRNTMRGVLCSGCNTTLGLVREDLTVIRGLEAYLLRWKA